MKVAILGKTGTRKDAPFNDFSWTIWGLGTGGAGVRLTTGEKVEIGRWDAWLELHSDLDTTPALRRHKRWLASQKKPIYTFGDPLSSRDLIERFGAYFMRNTVCWAMAYALHLKADEIGLWGIDQASGVEYERERHGVQHFIHLSRALGVPVYLPPGCALHEAPKPYPWNYD